MEGRTVRSKFLLALLHMMQVKAHFVVAARNSPGQDRTAQGSTLHCTCNSGPPARTIWALCCAPWTGPMSFFQWAMSRFTFVWTFAWTPTEFHHDLSTRVHCAENRYGFLDGAETRSLNRNIHASNPQGEQGLDSDGIFVLCFFFSFWLWEVRHSVVELENRHMSYLYDWSQALSIYFHLVIKRSQHLASWDCSRGVGGGCGSVPTIYHIPGYVISKGIH